MSDTSIKRLYAMRPMEHMMDQAARFTNKKDPLPAVLIKRGVIMPVAWSLCLIANLIQSLVSSIFTSLLSAAFPLVDDKIKNRFIKYLFTPTWRSLFLTRFAFQYLFQTFLPMSLSPLSLPSLPIKQREVLSHQDLVNWIDEEYEEKEAREMTNEEASKELQKASDSHPLTSLKPTHSQEKTLEMTLLKREKSHPKQKATSPSSAPTASLDRSEEELTSHVATLNRTIEEHTKATLDTTQEDDISLESLSDEELFQNIDTLLEELKVIQGKPPLDLHSSHPLPLEEANPTFPNRSEEMVKDSDTDSIGSFFSMEAGEEDALLLEI